MKKQHIKYAERTLRYVPTACALALGACLSLTLCTNALADGYGTRSHTPNAMHEFQSTDKQPVKEHHNSNPVDTLIVKPFNTMIVKPIQTMVNPPHHKKMVPVEVHVVKPDSSRVLRDFRSDENPSVFVDNGWVGRTYVVSGPAYYYGNGYFDDDVYYGPGPRFYGAGPGFYGAGYRYYNQWDEDTDHAMWYSGVVPENAIVVTTQMGQPVYACSAKINGHFYAGRFHHGRCHIQMKKHLYRTNEFRIHVR
jgi:hypothetical protein